MRTPRGSTSNTGFEGVHGGFGYGIRNQGEYVLSFALAYDMIVANTLFRKGELHLVTVSSGQHSSQIDFILSRREDRRACLDCKVIPGESVVPQHKLVVADFRFRIRVQRDKCAKVARTKWWKLKGEVAQAFKERVIKEGPWEEGGDAEMCTFKDHLQKYKHTEESADCTEKNLAVSQALASKVLSNANVHLVLMDMLVAFGIDDAPGICRRLRSETLSTSKPCLITIVVKGHTSEPLDLTAKPVSQDITTPTAHHLIINETLHHQHYRICKTATVHYRQRRADPEELGVEWRQSSPQQWSLIPDPWKQANLHGSKTEGNGWGTVE
ncbi:hypothetical protein TRIUR3_01874 [Triticum urartu]|uniref:Uncharacterized protein n=1 Tax=Triticum urartu TaxID=4572 RepID=M8AKY8_TRIUA|nr:hypothetical protein TRIUR3_01874 [Triticum urartu]